MYSSYHKYLSENFKPINTVLELGSGENTILLVDHFNQVYTVEQDLQYMDLVKEAFYLHCPLKNKWYNTEILQNFLYKFQYDILVIDGPRGSKSRAGLLNNFHLFNTNIPWIFDDTNRSNEKHIVEIFCERFNKTSEEFDCGDKKFTVVR